MKKKKLLGKCLAVAVILATTFVLPVKADEAERESLFSFYEEDIQYLENEIKELYDEIG